MLGIANFCLGIVAMAAACLGTCYHAASGRGRACITAKFAIVYVSGSWRLVAAVLGIVNYALDSSEILGDSHSAFYICILHLRMHELYACIHYLAALLRCQK